MLGVLSWSLEVQAGFFSSFMGERVSAESKSIALDKTIKNSQTMDLLEPSGALSMVVGERKDNGPQKDQSKDEIDETESVNILSENALLASVGPMSAMYGIGGYDFSSDDEDISIYVVRSGDTVEVVAKLFDVSPDTIYSANDMKKGDKLKQGDVLLILPFSGIEHSVAKGETLKGIAKKYDVPIEYILSANDIDEATKLVAGSKLMIPGGDMLSESKPKKSNSGLSTSKGSTYSNIPSVAGYFKNPVPGARKSRGVKPGHKGVDMAAPIGTSIYASASGTVMIARMGWNGGFGNYVIIQHPNGVKTLYAHLSKLGTAPGAKVSQGEVIGYVGSSGKSTGPHLHFETIGSKNPF